MTTEDSRPPANHDPTHEPRDHETTADRTLVEITRDVGRIVGVDGREYDLLKGDVVTLPSITAGPLLEKNAATLLAATDSDADARAPSVAEAEAVAGDEPIRDATPDPGPELPPAIEGELQRRRDTRADHSGDEDDLGAAAFMDPDSAHASNDDPEPDPSTSTEASYERTVSALPLVQLDALTPQERRRAARKRGLEWPTTSDARDRLFDELATVMRHEDDQVIDAPTSLGKSHTVAATRWGARDDLTDDQPVVHLSADPESPRRSHHHRIDLSD